MSTHFAPTALAGVCSFLAEAFLLPPGPSLIQKAKPLGMAALSGLGDYSDDDWQEAGEEYAQLFDGMRYPPLSLWASAYLSREPRLLDQTTLAIKDFYRRFGLGAEERFCQPPDHIGFLLSFFAWLLRRGAGNSCREFPDRFLKPFALAFSAELEQVAEHPLYKILAQLLGEAVNPPFDELGPQEISTKAPFGFRLLTEEEIREAMEEKLIPTCGTGNCGGRCPLRVRVRDGCVLEMLTEDTPEEEGILQIRACPRGLAYPHTFLRPDRLRYPMLRTGKRGEGKFKRISWEEATDLVARETVRIREQYGPRSRYVVYSSGINAVSRGEIFIRNLLALDGGYLGYYNSYSTACIRTATPYTYGTNDTGNVPEDLLNSKLIVLWGYNPAESLAGTHFSYYIKKARERGAKVIVVDPRCSDSAMGLADQWIGLRPTTDSALMDAMAYVIVSENLQDQSFMDRFCLGFDSAHMPKGYEGEESYLAYLKGHRDGIPKTPAWAAPITGVPAQVITAFAREYALAKPAALIQGFGPQRNANGEQTVRSGTMLTCLTGNVGIPGGHACGTGAPWHYPNPEIRTIPNPDPAEIPTFLWTEAVLRGKEMTAADGVRGVDGLGCNIKMIFSLAGNTLVNQHGDVNRTVDILRDESKVEFIVASDLFMTPSTRYADLVLPGTSLFETNNIGRPWQFGDVLLASNKVIEPLFESHFEYGWIADVAKKLGCYEKFSDGGKSADELLRNSYDRLRDQLPELPGYNSFKRAGIHRYRTNPHPVAFAEQIADPENNPFPTPSGKIEIFSPRLHDMGNPGEIPAIPKYVPCFEGVDDPLRQQYPLQLIGWHTMRRTHSTHDNNRWMEQMEPPALWLHPEDAEARSIADGDQAEVFNDRGKVLIPVKVTRRIVQGVAAMAQGAWFTPGPGGKDTRGSINVLTTSRPTPLAKGNPQHTNLVEVRLAEKKGDG